MKLTHARALALFRLLGADDPKWRAKSEAIDGQPQLARWLFLQALWANVTPDDFVWPGKWSDLDAPIPAATRRLLAHGIDPRDLTTVVRDAQITVLFNVCQLLDDSAHGIAHLQNKIAENVEWRLFEYDGRKEKPERRIGGLHEDFHDADPTGRSGEPEPRPKKPQARSKRASKKR